MRTASRFPRAAFSLAEVTLALGIAAFCLIAVFGLLPVGLTSNQNSMQQTTAASLASAVAADLRAAPPSSMLTTGTSSVSPLYRITIKEPGQANNQPQHLYFNMDGGPFSGGTADQPAPYNAASSSFRVSVAFFYPPSGKSATHARILVTWPAVADGDLSGNSWPSKNSGSLETVTALNRN